VTRPFSEITRPSKGIAAGLTLSQSVQLRNRKQWRKGCADGGTALTKRGYGINFYMGTSWIPYTRHGFPRVFKQHGHVSTVSIAPAIVPVARKRKRKTADTLEHCRYKIQDRLKLNHTNCRRSTSVSCCNQVLCRIARLHLHLSTRHSGPKHSQALPVQMEQELLGLQWRTSCGTLRRTAATIVNQYDNAEEFKRRTARCSPRE